MDYAASLKSSVSETCSRPRKLSQGPTSALAALPVDMQRVTGWPAVDIESLDAGAQVKYLARRQAIEQYLNGASLRTIAATTGTSSGELYRYLDRCLSTHADGRIQGLRGLIPGLHICCSSDKHKRAPYNPRSKTRGAFRNLLARIPHLEQKIEDYLLKRRKRYETGEPRPTLNGLRSMILEECRAAGLNPILDYPFCTQDPLYVTLSKHAKVVYRQHPARAAYVSGGSSGMRAATTGDGRERPVDHIYQRVECDAHHLDAIFCILVPTGRGEFVPIITDRLWVIMIVEVMSRAVLGYSLSMNAECDADDVLQAIKHALQPWSPKKNPRLDLQYSSTAGFPSSVDTRLVGMCWEEFWVDDAKVNHSSRVTDKLQQIMRVQPFTAKRHNPNDRPIVERLFGTLEEKGFHRLPNTTGSNPADPRRENPELAACRFYLDIFDLETILDAVIAEYNGTAHSSLHGRSPLTTLCWHVEHTTDRLALQQADPALVERLLLCRTSVKVRGRRGGLAHINFANASYTSDALRHAHHLVGQTLSIEYDPSEGRRVIAYGPNGEEIGPLFALSPWHRFPHSLRMRQAAARLHRSRKGNGAQYGADPIRQAYKILERRSIKNGKASTDHLIFYKYLQAHTDALAVLCDFDSVTIAPDERGQQQNDRRPIPTGAAPIGNPNQAPQLHVDLSAFQPRKAIVGQPDQ